MGLRVIPTLRQTLRRGDYPEIREGAAIALGYFGKQANSQRTVRALIAAIKFDDEVIVKASAALSLGKIAPESHQAMRTLVNVSNNADDLLRKACQKALVLIGKKAITYIRLGLSRIQDDILCRVMLIETLGQIGPDSSEMAGDLRRYYPSAAAIEKKAIIRTLGQIGGDIKKTIPMLLDSLLSEESEELHEIIRETILNLGKETIPRVIPLLKEPREITQKSAMYILKKFGAVATPYLVRIVINPKIEEKIKIKVIKLLSNDYSSINVFIKALYTTSPSVKKALIQGITRSGKVAVPKLIEALEISKNEQKLFSIRDCLVLIGKPSVPPLIKVAQKTPKREIKKIAIDAIAQIGPIAANIAAKPLLKILLEAPIKERPYIAKRLGRLGEQVIPLVVPLLFRKEEHIQKIAIITLEETKSKKAFDHVLKSLEKPHLLSLVIKTLVKRQQYAFPTLIKYLNDKNSYIRFACAASLFEIGSSKAKKALLKQIAIEKDPRVKYMLNMAIRRSRK